MRSFSDTCVEKGGADRPEADLSQRHGGGGPNSLYIVGIGPGDLAHLSGRACRVLESVDAVVGYTTYIDLIRPIVREKRIVSTGMTREVERVEAAVDLAVSGRSCALVSSGDPEIYAMAGLVFEMCRARGIPVYRPGPPAERTGIAVEVVPGIPALCAGAALLGAPLTHDFAVVSLSDLLTPWEKIERRIEAAASADFVIVLYNPKSKRRNWQLEKAGEILLRHRDGNTPVGIVSRAMREGEDVSIVPLARLREAPVDMQTIVFVGSSVSSAYFEFMVTPRGYAEKYELQEPGKGAHAFKATRNLEP
jgi:precorrin-3B C17-methyltransferase